MKVAERNVLLTSAFNEISIDPFHLTLALTYTSLTTNLIIDDPISSPQSLDDVFDDALGNK